MPKTTTSNTYTLLNWNCPRHLKNALDAVVDYKRISRTSIINTLLADYCRNEITAIEKDGEILSLIDSAQRKVSKQKNSSPPIEKKSNWSWESSYA
jgi:hypothetical protein